MKVLEIAIGGQIDEADRSLAAQTLGFKSVVSDRKLHHSAEVANILVDLSYVVGPSLGALVAIWMGRGKRVNLKVGKREVSLQNLTEKGAIEIVLAFLGEDQNISR